MNKNVFPYTLALIFLSGGKGSRFGSHLPKQYHLLDNEPLALKSLKTFLSLEIFSQIVIVSEKQFESRFPKHPCLVFALPGEKRQDSLLSGYQKLLPVDFVCIHDAARPFIKKEDVLKLIQEVIIHKAATLGVKATDTIKMVDDNLLVRSTLDRTKLYHIQTPQALSYDLLTKGLALIGEKSLTVTDDVALAELLHHPVKIVEGSPTNIKITYSEDLSCTATK